MCDFLSRFIEEHHLPNALLHLLPGQGQAYVLSLPDGVSGDDVAAVKQCPTAALVRLKADAVRELGDADIAVNVF